MVKDIEILLEIVFFFQLVLVSIILHEYGHYLLAKYYKLEPKIKINGRFISVEHKKTDPKKSLNILISGILSGLIYILFWISYNPFYFMNIIVIIGYTAACVSDMSQIYYLAYGKTKSKKCDM